MPSVSSSTSSSTSEPKSSKWQYIAPRVMSDVTNTRQDGQFTTEDFQYLCRNDFKRYAKNSPWVGHAIFIQQGDTEYAQQFNIPASTHAPYPVVKQLHSFERIIRGGMVRYQAKSSTGERWIARRYEDAIIKIDDIETTAKVAYFSEDEEDSDNETDITEKWGDSQPITRFKPSFISSSSSPRSKGGHDLLVDPTSVLNRDLNKIRGVDQNTVMDTPELKAQRTSDRVNKGHSARDAYEVFFKQFENQLSDEIIELLKRAFHASIDKHPDKQYRPEWLHAYGFSLTPDSQNPQLRMNLGAAGAYVNTEMTILESMAKWFALNINSNTNVSINALFTMLDQSELIDKINFSTSITFKNVMVQLKQELDPFRRNPLFRKGSDVAQLTGIVHAINHQVSPANITEVRPAETPKQPKTYRQVPEGATFESIPSQQPEADKKLLIFDLETTGLNFKEHKIIELGALLATFNQTQGVLDCVDSYNGLEDPKEPLSDEVKTVTHITDEMLLGQSIDWSHFLHMLNQADYVFCHNSNFDRRFIEAHAPEAVKAALKTKFFGCTLYDIDWFSKGYKSHNLISLNKRLNFVFTGHRAVNDCWATLNLLRQVDHALPELLNNIHKTTHLICAIQTEFSKKDILAEKGFRWSSGEEYSIPKCWYIYAEEDELEEVKTWLNTFVYDQTSNRPAVPVKQNITAAERYSERSELEPRLFAEIQAKLLVQATTKKSSKKRPLPESKKPTASPSSAKRVCKKKPPSYMKSASHKASPTLFKPAERAEIPQMTGDPQPEYR